MDKNIINTFFVPNIGIEEVPIASWKKTKASETPSAGSFIVPHHSDDLNPERLQYVAYAMPPEVLKKMLDEMREFFPQPFLTKIEDTEVEDPMGSNTMIKSSRLEVITPKKDAWLDLIKTPMKTVENKTIPLVKSFFIGKMGFRLHVEDKMNPAVMKEFIESNPSFFTYFSDILVQDNRLVIFTNNKKNKKRWIRFVNSHLLKLRKPGFGDIHITTEQELKDEEAKKIAHLERKRQFGYTLKLKEIKQLIISEGESQDEAFSIARELNASIIFRMSSGSFLVVAKKDVKTIIDELKKRGAVNHIHELLIDGVPVYEG